jgi:uncharacterized protein (TIGR02246 family)
MTQLRLLALLGSMGLALIAPRELTAQGGMGGAQPPANAATNAYRADVRNRLHRTLLKLAEAWDGSDPGAAAVLFADKGVIVLGPDRTITGRAAIRSAFGLTLRQMRGVVLTFDDYDLSDALAVVRGTMMYELIHDGRSGTHATVAYTMVLRRQRNNEWLIHMHMLAGAPALPEAHRAGGSQPP